MAWYHIVEEVLLSELSIYAHYVMYDEWNYTILYMYTNMEEV
jgi:hypothetical protein